MNKVVVILVSILTALSFGALLFFTVTPTGKAIINNWEYSLNKVDERDYEHQKEVEDTCRMMIASYNNDKMIYMQYKDSEKSVEIEMSNNARTRANQTASTYNNYILKNKYVWRDNVPNDIYLTLEYL